MKRGQIVKTIT